MYSLMNEISVFLYAVEANTLNPTAIEYQLTRFRTDLHGFITGLLELSVQSIYALILLKNETKLITDVDLLLFIAESVIKIQHCPELRNEILRICCKSLN